MVEIRGVSKSFQKTVKDNTTEVKALTDVNLSVRANEFVSIIGPSGCGKTTLLKIIDGLIPCDSGQISINGKQVTTPGPDRAVVFQTFALLPWRTVLANVEFSLELRQSPKKSVPAPRAIISSGSASLISRITILMSFPAVCSNAPDWRAPWRSIP